MTGRFLKNKYTIPAAVAVFSLVLSLALWCAHFPGIRRTFIFRSSASGKRCVESRFLPVRPVQGAESCYIDEVLLGPETEQCRPLFSPGTKRESAFRRRGTLYINLTADALTESSGSGDIKEGTELFLKNVRRNFRGIHEIELFIDAKRVYENTQNDKKALTKKKS